MKRSSGARILLLTALFVGVFTGVYSYECYVCKDQDNNSEKCVKTVRACDIAENACMTIVRWGSSPYYDQKGNKQYYVSKQCATTLLCETMKTNMSRRCDRIWFNDWECAECCTGDRCNYFITLSGSSLQPVVLFTAVTVSVTLLISSFFS